MSTAPAARSASAAASPAALPLRVALPKGRMHGGVVRLLDEAGIRLRMTARDYRPTISLPDTTVKILKPQSIVEMLHAGARDLGFAGADWVAELDANLVEVLDTGLDAVELVAAAPESILADGRLPARRIIVASEMPRLTEAWIRERGLDATLLRSWGATEVLPPEDADCIVDITATGATLAANGLEIVDVLRRSSTRLYASRAAWEDPARRAAIERVRMLLESVLAARRRVMLELNVDAERLDRIVDIIPCMREPTISTLRGSQGYAVKAAVPRDVLPTLIPELRRAGGTDLVISDIQQIIA